MSATAYEREYLAAPVAGPLRARPAGVRAALGMGVSASLVLIGALIFTGRAAPHVAGAASPEAQALAALAENASDRSPTKFAIKVVAETPAAGVKFSPFSAFDLSAPAFDQEAKTIAVRDGDDGAGPIDSLTFGRFAQGGPFMRVDIHRDVAEKEKAADFFLDMTRHATQLGLNAAKIGQPSVMATRFGAFETADIKLTQPAGDGVAASERACMAARLIEPKLSLEIAGIACGSATAAIDRHAFGCMLDRLTYVGASDNKAFSDFFGAVDGAAAKGCAAGVSTEDVTASIPRKPRPKAAAHKPRAKR